MTDVVLLDQINDQYIIKIDNEWYQYITGKDLETNDISSQNEDLLSQIINNNSEYSKPFANTEDLLKDLYTN